jgi:hypothetical protein
MIKERKRLIEDVLSVGELPTSVERIIKENMLEMEIVCDHFLSGGEITLGDMLKYYEAKGYANIHSVEGESSEGDRARFLKKGLSATSMYNSLSSEVIFPADKEDSAK